MDDRYAGKPFLRLLELYALTKIGALAEGDASTLEQMTPKLRSLYKRQGNWIEIVAAEMALDAAADEAIRSNWSRWREKRGDRDPEAFARAFADAMVR